jgi:hypothetical protein
MLRDWEKRYPGRVENIFSSLSRVTPSHLMDRNLFDFAAAVADGVPSADGDIAFDVDPVLEATPAEPGSSGDALRGSFTIALQPVDTGGQAVTQSTEFKSADAEPHSRQH